MSYEFNLKEALDTLATNPTSVQRIVLGAIEQASGSGDKIIVDGGSPAGLLLEMACGLFAYNTAQIDAEFRRLYPELAKEPLDLYRHMADVDYPSVFSTPSVGYFNFVFDEREIINKALPVTGKPYKLLTVPCFTSITVAGVTFTLQRPIELRVSTSGTVQPVIDETFYTPLKTVSNSDIKIQRIIRREIPLLVVNLPVQQIEITSNNVKPTSITGYDTEFSFLNEFYAARAYIKNASGQYVEIKTTFSDQVYDVNYPTVKLKLNGKRLRVTVPQIYFSNGAIKDNLRIDIYTTKGSLKLNLTDYTASEFSYKLTGVNSRSVDAFSAPLMTFSTMGVTSSTEIAEGDVAITFDQLRDRVIARSASTEGLPITPNQLRTYVKNSGFDLTVAIDRVNERKMLASRSLPAPAALTTSSGLGCQIEGFTFKAVELEAQPYIYQTGNRYTISPKVLFKLDNGRVKLVDASYTSNLLDPDVTSIEQLSTIVNAGNFIFTPFHYVADITNTELSSRAYLLTQPKVNATYFVADNPATEVSARIKASNITLTDDGYTILVEIDGSSVFKEFTVDQLNFVLSYVIPNSTGRYRNVGTFVGAINGVTGKPENGRYIYQFDIPLSFDVDREHYLLHRTTLIQMALNTTFDLVGVVKNHYPAGTTPTEMDGFYDVTELNEYDPTAMFIGFMNDRMDIEFGTYLSGLWNRNRSVISELEYEYVQVDVPLYYEEDVLETDANGLKLYYNEATEEYETRVLFSAGEPQLDELGLPRYKYRAGDVLRDALGNPVLKNGIRGITRIIEMLFIDGKYFFATDQVSVDYLKLSTAYLNDWSTSSIEDLQGEMINQTQLFFYPKNVLGALEVLVGNDERAFVSAEQKLQVAFYVSGSVLRNAKLRAKIVDETKLAINDAFKSLTVSNSSIYDAIRKRISQDVISFKISGFLNDKYDTVTIVDGSMQFALAKSLVPLSNLTLQVQDFLSVDFLKQGE